MVGVANNNLSKQDINAIKDKLAEQREEILETIELNKLKLLQMDLTNPDRSTLAKVFTQREHIETTISGAEYQWAKIEKAFDRFNRGAYGLCSQCEKKINVDRLKVIPAAEHCVECQENVENNNS